MQHKANKSISLVLGSGGARGLAHIGVIQVLERHGYQIKSISGCSAGAVVGGVYAAGKLAEFEQWVRAIDTFDILALMDISWSGGGLVKGDKVINTLKALLGEYKIEELDISYTAIAADIKHEKEVWLNSGSLFDAIRASMSLPLFFTPVKYKGGYLIDGGVLNPVPIAPTFSDNTDLTIAVNLAGDADYSAVLDDKEAELELSPKPQPDPIAGEKSEKNSAGEAKDNSLHDSILNFIKKLQEPKEEEPQTSAKADKDWGMYEVANQAFDTMQGTIARQKLAAYPPDLVIELPRNAAGILELDKADELIELGRVKAEQALALFERR